MLARRLTTLLPAMTLDALETTRMHPVAGLTAHCTAFMTVSPASV
jgi:hypothetical protein